MTANSKLEVGDVLSNGIALGLKNFVTLLLTVILFVLTFWIPYLNIGTFIALQDIVPKISRGESISPTDIFDAKYRRHIGEFFLLAGLFYAGVLFGYIFMMVGGIVVLLSWSLAMPMFVDKGTAPIESLRKSNEYTYGNKATIFLSMLALYAGIFIVVLILNLISQTLGSIVGFILGILAFPMFIGMQAYIYGRLVPGAEFAGDAETEMAPAV